MRARQKKTPGEEMAFATTPGGVSVLRHFGRARVTSHASTPTHVKALLAMHLAVRSIVEEGPFLTQTYIDHARMARGFSWWIFPQHNKASSPLMGYVEARVVGEEVAWHTQVELFWRLAAHVRVEGLSKEGRLHGTFSTAEAAFAHVKATLTAETERWVQWARAHAGAEKLGGGQAEANIIPECFGITVADHYKESWRAFLRYRGVEDYEKWLGGQGEEA